jgi:hypothetical protein
LQSGITNGGKLSFSRSVDFLTTLTTDLYGHADLKKREIISDFLWWRSELLMNGYSGS